MVAQMRVQARMVAISQVLNRPVRCPAPAGLAVAHKGVIASRLRRRLAATAAETATVTAELPSASAAEALSGFPPALPPLDDGYEAACAFAPFANWIIPGALMLGRYPYVEPARCATRDAGDAQVEAIVTAGPTTFVCLQAELPPQGEMRLAGVDGFLPYRAAAQLVAAARSEPPSMEEVAALRTPELDRYLPPRRRPVSYPPRRRVEVDFVHCGISDLGIPEERQLAALLVELEARLARGEVLYLHCWGGRGRAGTVAATLLGKVYGMGADEALTRVQRAFDTRGDGGRRSPETPQQHEFIARFIEQRLWEQ